MLLDSGFLIFILNQLNLKLFNIKFNVKKEVTIKVANHVVSLIGFTDFLNQ